MPHHIQRQDIYYIGGIIRLRYKQLYRVKHDVELGGVRQVVLDRNVPLPEVYPLFPNQHTSLNYDWQWLWKDICPQLTGMEWRKLLHNERAFCNDQGFEKEGDPRVDYVNGLAIGAEEPKIEALLMGGMVVTGNETVYRGEPSLEVDVLNGNEPPPSPNWMRQHPEFMGQAVSVRPDGRVQSFSLTPYPEYIPIIAHDLPVYYPLEFLEKLPKGSAVPSPYY